MLYTTSLMKRIPDSPGKCNTYNFIFSSNPDISQGSAGHSDLLGLLKKRPNPENIICSRHRLYHHDPHCHRHQHQHHHQHHQSHSQNQPFENRTQNLLNEKSNYDFDENYETKLEECTRQLFNKQNSLPLKFHKENLPTFETDQIIDKSTYQNKNYANYQSYLMASKQNCNLFKTNDIINDRTNAIIHELDYTIKPLANTLLLNHKSCPNLKYLNDHNSNNVTINHHNLDADSFEQLLTNSSEKNNEIRSSQEDSITKFTTKLNKPKFNERLLYFPTINNQILNDYKKTFHKQSSSSNLNSNIIENNNINNDILMSRKKTLKFAVPDFLVPILDRSIPCDINNRRYTETVINTNTKIFKKRITLKEKLKNKLNSSILHSHLWNQHNFINSFVDSDDLSSLRDRSNTIISTNFTDPKSSLSHISDSSCDDCRRVVLNVSGLKFETWLTVLDRHPQTLLGNINKRNQYYDHKYDEYFFDRHRPSFEAIFNYYQYGGRLKRPPTVPDDVFLNELEFFQIENEALDIYKKNEGYVPDIIILPENHLKRKLWMLFEYPETSLLAFGFSITSFLFTVISIILFCVETLPIYAQTHCEPGAKPNFRDPFFIIETLCTIWFTLELFIRFISCPSHKKFLKDFKNLIDLAAIIPYYITLFNVLITFSCEGAKNSASLAFLRVIRLIRVFKLTKHSSGLQVLVLTFKESLEGLSLFLVAFIVCILVFSSTIYYVEIDRKGSQIESIPDAFWWAVITMCTVGYGDKVPKGPLGKVVGSICAVAGVLTLAIPVPIITENFNKFYAHKTGRGRR